MVTEEQQIPWLHVLYTEWDKTVFIHKNKIVFIINQTL